MITDKNILASKHITGPWIVRKGLYQYEIQQGDKPSPLNLRIVDAGYHSTHRDEQTKANAYIISAAPEAIEFIADLMEFFDFIELLETDKINIEPWRNKAEKIIKKAYNF